MTFSPSPPPFDHAHADVPSAPAEESVASRAHERLREAQGMLASLGYAISGRGDAASASDVVLGHNTRRAIGQFQLSQGIDVSGQLDEETWLALTDACA